MESCSFGDKHDNVSRDVVESIFLLQSYCVALSEHFMSFMIFSPKRKSGLSLNNSPHRTHRQEDFAISECQAAPRRLAFTSITSGNGSVSMRSSEFAQSVTCN